MLLASFALSLGPFDRATFQRSQRNKSTMGTESLGQRAFHLRSNHFRTTTRRSWPRQRSFCEVISSLTIPDDNKNLIDMCRFLALNYELVFE